MKATKKNSIKYLPLLLGGMGLFASSANGAVTLENGYLALAFYQVSGNVVQANTLVFDLGSASLYRENSLGSASVSTINTGILSANIGTQLVNAFGPNWADAGTVRWMVVGGVNGAAAPVNGDPNRSFYFSTNLSTVPGSTLRSQIANQIGTFGTSTLNETSTANADATQIPITDIGSVDEFLNPTAAGLYFAQSQDITQTLGAGTISGSIEGSLDVYRYVNATTGTGYDATAGLSAGNAVVGVGQYIGTFQLSSSGNLSVIPEPSAALLGLVGTAGLVLRRRRNA